MAPSLDGAPVLEARVRLPRRGVWVASLQVDTRTAPSGHVTLALDGLDLVGTVRRAGDWQGTMHLQLVGGAGGLATELNPKAYRSATGSIAVGDVLSAAGETLALAADATALGGALNAWVRTAGPAASALEQLLGALGIPDWRVLPDGTVWVGTDAWPAATVGFEVLEEDPAHGRLELRADDQSLAPGTTLDSRRVSVVEHRIEAGRLRTLVWTE